MVDHIQEPEEIGLVAGRSRNIRNRGSLCPLPLHRSAHLCPPLVRLDDIGGPSVPPTDGPSSCREGLAPWRSD